MPSIKELLQKVAGEERASRERPFLAPCVRRGLVRVRVGGLIESYRPRPSDFEGWGIFQPVNTNVAALQEEADLFQIEDYLNRMPKMPWRLCARLRGRAWLAYPINVGDAKQRFGLCKPGVVHLVSEASRFDVVDARFDGCSWWHQELDFTADPLDADQLKDSFAGDPRAEDLAWKGLTPEMRQAFSYARQPWTAFELGKRRTTESIEVVPEPPTDEQRLTEALQKGGGRLLGYRSHDSHWMVEWETSEGERQHSAINKQDMTVVSAGICLDGQDADFDLASLVAVVEKAEYW